MDNENGGRIALIVIIVFFILVIICLVFSGVSYFGNLKYSYKLPVIGNVPNLQMATVPRLSLVSNSDEPSSSDEPNEPSSSDEPSSSETRISYSDQSLLIGLYSNERRNMNPFGNYKIISDTKKQESKEIDNLLQRLHLASNSGLLGQVDQYVG